MNFKRLTQIQHRIKQNLSIIRLAKNWKDILSAKLDQKPVNKIIFRNGVVINSPNEIDLNFLFHEIWLDELYSAKGYEIKPNDVVFDIGANIGVFAFYAATRDASVKVYSYEPFPKNAAYFEQNLKESQLKNVTFYNLAVAGDSTERTLHVHESWIKHSLSENPSDTGGISVGCVSLEQALADFTKCDLLKLDCEGSEYEILYSSLPETLGKIKRIIGEYHNLDDKERNGESLRKFLEKNNYQIDAFHSFADNCGFICAKKS